MHPTLRLGSRGGEVSDLQGRLNGRPSALPRLLTDGVFGPKTQARVIEFQRQNGLVADGVVGPKTWAALDAGAARRERPTVCGNGDAGNLARVESIRQQFLAALGGAVAATSSPAGTRSGFASPGVGGGTPGLALLPSLNPLAGFKPFAGSPQDTAAVRSRFGASIDFSSVFISDRSGLSGRAFTVGFTLPFPIGGLPPVVQVMNLGKSPKESTVIHELTHVWQSQHHSDPVAFMKNCVACQAVALGQNGSAAQSDPTLIKETAAGFPDNFPFSAYGYRKGLAFSLYGGEQVAQQVQRGEAGIVAKVRATPARAVDSDNVASLNRNVSTEDLRLTGIVFV